jgi:flagellar biosynthetic protein FlhB
MSDDRDDSQRTEEPTQRRLEQAHEQGDVVRSTEISSFILLSGGTLALVALSASAATRFMGTFTVYLERPEQLVVNGQGIGAIYQQAINGLLAVVGPMIGLLVAAALTGHLIQHRPVFSVEKLKPDFSKLSPIKGFARLFGPDGWINLLKGVLKMLLVGSASYLALWPSREKLALALDLPPAGLAALALALVGKVLLAALCVLGALAGLDYFYQRHRFMKRQRMTRQELRDEHKQNEGDPQIKAKIRRLRHERSRRRMMAAVPKASVVITNPTHYAVALAYESGKMAAPVCVAKGMDALALRIREVAQEHDVPIVENPPLARALYATVEVDDPIPVEHYKAVAQIIGYVMRLASRRSFWKN